ncbi:permease [bacterium]|nr:permease [bacterium]
MLWNIFSTTWAFSREAAPFLLLGFGLAGLLHAFVNERTVAAHLGGPGLGPVFKAALIGAPLPLCSCGVLPAAAALRKGGASRGATTAFLISTPETGVDSVAVSWAMLDPLMTVARPLAALATALVTGAAEVLLGPKEEAPSSPTFSAALPEKRGLAGRLREGGRYGYFVLMADLGWYLLWGFILAGAISAFLPKGFLAELPGGQWSTLGLIIALGVPLYICATSSTPLAAALIAKGISPGAALLLLLVGPATNLAALSLIWRIQGPRSTLIYLSGVVVVGLLCAFGLDWVYSAFGITPSVAASGLEAGAAGAWGAVTGVILWLLIGYGVYKEKIRPRLRRARAGR